MIAQLVVHPGFLASRSLGQQVGVAGSLEIQIAQRRRFESGPGANAQSKVGRDAVRVAEQPGEMVPELTVVVVATLICQECMPTSPKYPANAELIRRESFVKGGSVARAARDIRPPRWPFQDLP